MSLLLATATVLPQSHAASPPAKPLSATPIPSRPGSSPAAQHAEGTTEPNRQPKATLSEVAESGEKVLDPWSGDPDYRIAPPDILRLTAKELKTVEGGTEATDILMAIGKTALELLVEPDGNVRFGAGQSAYVTGKSIRQAEQEIEQVLAKTFVDPEVTLELARCNSRFCYIISGREHDSGNSILRLPVHPRTSITQLVAYSQIELEGTTVRIKRPAFTSDHQPADDVEITIDGQGLRDGDSSAAATLIYAGDRIYIESEKLEKESSYSDTRIRQIVAHYQDLLRAGQRLEATELVQELFKQNPDHPVVQLLAEHATLADDAGNDGDVKSRIYAQAYYVADLLRPISNFPSPEKEQQPKSSDAPNFDPLINLITETVSPKSWDDVGGEASVQCFPTNLSLMICQTQAGHEQVALLLSVLRQLQETEASNAE